MTVQDMNCHRDPAVVAPRHLCPCEACYRTRLDRLPEELYEAYRAAIVPTTTEWSLPPTTADALLVRVIDVYLRGHQTLDEALLELVRQLHGRANLFERELLSYLALQPALPASRFRLRFPPYGSSGA